MSNNNEMKEIHQLFLSTVLIHISVGWPLHTVLTRLWRHSPLDSSLEGAGIPYHTIIQTPASCTLWYEHQLNEKIIYHRRHTHVHHNTNNSLTRKLFFHTRHTHAHNITNNSLIKTLVGECYRVCVVMEICIFIQGIWLSVFNRKVAQKSTKTWIYINLSLKISVYVIVCRTKRRLCFI